MPPRNPQASATSASAAATSAGNGGSPASPGGKKAPSFDANAPTASATTLTAPAAGGPDAAAANAASLGGAYIVRLRCGPPSRYLRKERLWPHVRELADRAIAHVRSTLAALSDAGAPCELYCVHGHYADAGEAAALMAATLGVDMVITGWFSSTFGISSFFFSSEVFEASLSSSPHALPLFQSIAQATPSAATSSSTSWAPGP